MFLSVKIPDPKFLLKQKTNWFPQVRNIVEGIDDRNYQFGLTKTLQFLDNFNKVIQATVAKCC